MKLKKNSEVSTQVIFFILMSLIFVWIIYFGITKILFVSDTLSDQELIEINNNLKQAFEYCEDPLNRGNFKVFKIDNPRFNSVCVFAGDVNEVSNYVNNDLFNKTLKLVDINVGRSWDSEASQILSAGDNVILFKSNLYKDADKYVFSDYNILDSFRIETEIPLVYCAFDLEGDGELEFRLSCE